MTKTTYVSSFTYTKHDELYGQHIPKETPELISTKLQELEKELDALPSKAKQSWIVALEKCPELCDDKFKLMFLRCEIFNCKKAAKRICNYWKKRIELFGEDLAFQPLVLGPNGPFQNDTEYMRGTPWIYNLHGKDLAGRPILFFDATNLPTDHSTYDYKSVIRTFWYSLLAALDGDETAQRKGIILMMHVKHWKLAAVNRKASQACTDALKGIIPIRISAIHVCHTPRIFELIYAIFKLFLGPHLRKKIQIHNGSEESVLKILNEDFGISSDKVPTEMGGTYKLEYLEWLDEREKKRIMKNPVRHHELTFLLFVATVSSLFGVFLGYGG